jgi:hypothetical protein
MMMPMCVVAIQKILDFVGDYDEEDMYVLVLEGALLRVVQYVFTLVSNKPKPKPNNKNITLPHNS